MIEFVSSWLGLIAQSLLPIGVTVVVLWVMDTRIRSLPAHYRSWMWRLFFFKCFCIAIIPWYSGIPQLSSLSAQLHRIWISHPPAATTRLDTDHANTNHSNKMTVATTGGAAVKALANTSPRLAADAGRILGSRTVGETSVPDNQTGAGSAQSSETASSHRWLGDWLANEELLVSLFLVWLLCASIQLALLGHNYARMITVVRRGSIASDPRLLQLYRSTARQLGLRQPPPLRLSDNAQGPALVYCGAVKIVLPRSFRDRFGEQACTMAFAHELGHFVRRDILWNMIATVVTIVFWFYPPVWIALRRYRIAMESACDELAVRGARLDRPSYARLLVSLLEATSAPRSSPIILTMARSESFYSLSERLHAMKNSEYSGGSRVFSAVLLTTVAVWLLVPWSIADEPTSAAKPSQTKSSQLRLQSGSQPDSRPQPFREGAFAGGSASAGGFASGGAGGNGFSSGNAIVSGSGSVSGGGSEDNGYRSGYQDRKNNDKTARFSSSASSSGFGNQLKNSAMANGSAGVSDMAPTGSTNSSSGSVRTSVNTSTDGDTRIIKSMSVVDGERVNSTRIVTKQETITVRESDEEGVEVRVTKRGQRSRDAKVYLADSMTEFATEHPEVYESIKKYVAGNPAEAMIVTDDTLDLSKQMNSATQANPAKQMLVDQLEKVLGEVGDNPQLESVIRQMIRDNQ